MFPYSKGLFVCLFKGLKPFDGTCYSVLKPCDRYGGKFKFVLRYLMIKKQHLIEGCALVL